MKGNDKNKDVVTDTPTRNCYIPQRLFIIVRSRFNCPKKLNLWPYHTHSSVSVQYVNNHLHGSWNSLRFIIVQFWNTYTCISGKIWITMLLEKSVAFLFIYLYILYILTQICMVTKLSCGIKPKAKAVYSYDWWCMNSLQVHHHLKIENNPGKVSCTVSKKETPLLWDSL